MVFSYKMAVMRNVFRRPKGRFYFYSRGFDLDCLVKVSKTRSSLNKRMFDKAK
jgi:hypothetical protein